MQFKLLSTYKITHFSGAVERVNAETMEQALENLVTPESEDPVVDTVRTAYDINTLVNDDPKLVILTMNIEDDTPEGEVTPNIATPSTGNVHVGDLITLQAVPARNYAFVGWEVEGEVISTQEKFAYTIPDVEGEAIVIKAVFTLGNVEWTAEVSPAEATAVGCVAFPGNGSTKANEELGIIAVAKGDYTFDHWERNGVSIGTNEILQTTATPLAEGEVSAVYTAVYTKD